MMKARILLTALLLLSLGVSLAQAQQELPNAFQVSGKQAAAPDAAGMQAVIQDSRIALLIDKQVYLNTLALRHMPGYRVQVISTMDRSKANAAKAKLMQLFPDYDTYLSYQSPYFRVRIGDFRSQEDAEALQQRLNEYFPNGVFTVRDYIHITPEQLLQNLNNDPEH